MTYLYTGSEHVKQVADFESVVFYIMERDINYCDAVGRLCCDSTVLFNLEKDGFTFFCSTNISFAQITNIAEELL